MKISALNSYSPKFTSHKASSDQEPKENFLDKFKTDIINSADLNDTIQVPRTIFKGYLAFTAGTALTTVAAIAKNRLPKVSNGLNIASAALIIYGTYSFVRPYLIRDRTGEGH